MEYVSIIAAATGAYTFGAFWYGVNGRRWMEAAGVKADKNGRPESGGNILPYGVAAMAVLVVSAMMNHLFSISGIASAGSGFLAGAEIGLFIALPWIVTNYTYAGRPAALILIDGIFAAVGCAIIGAILNLI